MTDFEHDKAYIKDNKVILKEQEGFAEREIGEIRESAQQTIEYFEERFSHLKAKVDDVQSKIESEDNKGSFLMKVLNLRESLSSYDGIGDFTGLDHRLNQLENMLNEYIEQNRTRNTEVKRTLIEEAKQYAENPNWKEATEQLKELKQRWIRIGAVAEEQRDEIENEFQKIYTTFFDKKQEFYETKKQMIESRIASYQDLVSKAKKASQDMKEELRDELLQEWKSLGGIPKEHYDSLIKEFKKYTNSFRKNKANKGKKIGKEDLSKLVSQKEQLLEKAKQIKNDSVSSATENIKNLQKEWKVLGSSFGKSEKESELNDEFYFIGDYVFEKSFIESLFSKKWRGKEADDDKKAIEFKIKLVKDLLYRDKKELEVFEENLEKFNIGTNKMDRLVSSKHEKQKRKIDVKKEILKELNDLLKKMK